jgi:Fe-S-cluster-containing dehydrogenase component
MSKIFVIDVAKCTGCYNCQLACKDEHCGNDWAPYAAPQPDTGHFWCKVDEFVRGTIPKVKIHYISKMCAHCADAACMAACAHDAIRRRDDGFVLIDPAACTGCGSCVPACPHGTIYFNDKLHIAQKCTGCTHLLDHGAAAPRCVEACPTDAIQFGEKAELLGALTDATPLDPTGRVYYRHIPGRFIAGTVYDPIEKEVIIGGTCTLTGNGQTQTVKTDSYGDFWFRNLPENTTYDLTIEADGFQCKRFDALCSTPDVNLGDIPMEKA